MANSRPQPREAIVHGPPLVFDPQGPWTLGEMLRRAAAAAPQCGIVLVAEDGREEFLAYPELLQRATRCLGGLQNLGLQAGNKVILLPRNDAASVIAFWACILGGIVPVPLPHGLASGPTSADTEHLPPELERLLGVWRALDHPLVIAPPGWPSHGERLTRHAGDAKLEIMTTAELIARHASGDWHTAAAGDTALLLYSSGSTSQPKGIVLSHYNVLANLQATAVHNRFGEHDPTLCWAPLYHVIGLMCFHLLPIWTRASQVLLEPLTLIKRPELWFEKIDAHRVAFTGGPNFAFSLARSRVSRERLAEWDLSCLKVMLNGGEVVSVGVLEEFHEHFTACGLRPEAMAPAYGMSEASAGIAYPRPDEPLRIFRLDRRRFAHDRHVELVDASAADAVQFANLGDPLPGFSLRIVNDRDAVLRERQVGHVQIRGPAVTQGYYQDRQATREVFCDGWLRTGDLGFVDGGQLAIVGRAKDVLIIHGHNYYAHDLEQAALKVPGVVPGRAVAVSALNRRGDAECAVLFVALLPDLNAADVVARIHQEIRAATGVQLDHVIALDEAEFPRTPTGKIHRYRLKQLFEKGRFDEWLASSRQAERAAVPPGDVVANVVNGNGADPIQSRRVAQQLLGQIARALNVDAGELDPRTSFVELGIDSILAVELIRDLERQLDCELPATLAFDHPNAVDLAAHLVETSSPQAIERFCAAGDVDHDPTKHDGSAAAPSQAYATAGQRTELSADDFDPITDVRLKRDDASDSQSFDVAVIGMAGRLPGAANLDEFWRNLAAGASSVREVPPERWNPDEIYSPDPDAPGRSTSKWAGLIKGIDQFDARLFGISPHEAERMDPQQRLLLEVCWEALESAGYGGDVLSDTATGVFVGVSLHEYLRYVLADRDRVDAYAATGNFLSIVANRVSYFWNLKGPSLSVDTACSSSLVALHLAVESLRRGESTTALVGGVHVLLSPELWINFSKAGMLARDGRLKAFDHRADGYVRGEGVGAVLLKPLAAALADGDVIHAVIKGTAVNQDGRTNGLTAPSGPAQVEVLRQAQQRAGVDPRSITYVEAHGTGTALGDPIEVAALSEHFGSAGRQPQFCALGSVKSNIGHLEPASGMAGLLKVILALKHQQLPPTLHFEVPNAHLRLERTPFYVVDRVRPWPSPDGPRRAGVSSFGFGGTNAHVVVEEAPAAQPVSNAIQRPRHLLALSARSPQALSQLAERFAGHLDSDSDEPLADLCFTANTGRAQLPHRLAVPGATPADVAAKLRAACHDATAKAVGPTTQSAKSHAGRHRGEIVFLFAGQGAQYPGMARQLDATQPTFRRAIDHCAEVAADELGISLAALIRDEQRSADELRQTRFTQPSLFAVEYALAELWRSWGVEPAAVIGHSLGEYVAACVAGVMSVEDALRLVARRAHLMQSLPEAGAMTVVLAAPDEVARRIEPYGSQLAIAALNGPSNTVVSGTEAAVNALLGELKRDDILAQRLAVSQAFHSPLVEPMLDEFEWAAQQVAIRTPRLPLISNVTGRPLGGEEPIDAAYWRRHARQPVRFGDGVRHLIDAGYEWFLEIGPGATLTSMGRRIAGAQRLQWLPSLMQGRDDWDVLLESMARLYTAGLPIDFVGFDRDYRRRRVTVPTYPFERQRYWIAAATPREATRYAESAQVSASPPRQAEPPDESWFYRLAWQARPPARGGLPRRGAWIVLNGDEEIAHRIVARLRSSGCRAIEVAPGDWFSRSADRFHVNPSSVEDFRRLLDEVRQGGEPVAGIVHAWTCREADRAAIHAETITTRQLHDGVYSLRALAIALASAAGAGVPLYVVSANAQHVEGVDREPAVAASAAMWSLARVVQREMPHLAVHCIDVDAAEMRSDGALGEQFWLEITSAGPDGEIALRRGRRYGPSLVPAERVAAEPLPIRRDGVYLITGGLGDVGLDLADVLASRGATRLVLTGRQPLPPETEWPRWIDRHPAVDRTSRKLRAIRRLRESGALVWSVAVDVADRASTERLVADIHRHLGPLSGIVHAAGILDDGLLVRQSREAFDAVLRPKVVGAEVLAAVTASEPLDFFIAISSLASIWGNVGQGAYAAASGYLDALASWLGATAGLSSSAVTGGRLTPGPSVAQAGSLCGDEQAGRLLYASGPLTPGPSPARGEGRSRYMSLAFAPWSDIGMAARSFDATDWQATGLVPITPERGRRLFAYAIDHPQSQRFVLAPAHHDASILQRAFITGSAADDDHRGREALRAEVPTKEITDAVTHYILAELSRLLGLPPEEIALDANVLELGFDSIMATQLARRLSKHVGGDVSPTIIFAQPTAEKLAEQLAALYPHAWHERQPTLAAATTPSTTSVHLAPIETHSPAPVPTTPRHGAIAVIGMGGRFPLAPTPATFWENMRQGIDAVREVPPQRWDVARYYDPRRGAAGKSASKWGALLEGVDEFDAAFFRIAPREAEQMDPQQRILLEVAWETIESAGYAGGQLSRGRTGVFVGAMASEYLPRLLSHGDQPQRHVGTGNAMSVIANRLSYFLDLDGPCLTIDTACSSSLVALHLAVESLRRGECDAALVAGTQAGLAVSHYQVMSRLGVLSPTGRCRTFDRGADGYVLGEGVGAVLLKPLERALADGDVIHGVVRGTAVNHGGQAAGLTVPRAQRQAEVVRRALADAGVTADTIDYVEAHGTGTALGDPIEIAGLVEAFRADTSRQQFCAIGTVKSHIGHLEPAAGIAGLIRALLALKAGELPPTLHVHETNPAIAFAETPFYVNDVLKPWPSTGRPRRAAVSSFGFGGTNAHAIVEEAPAAVQRSSPKPRQSMPVHLLVLSAKTPAALDVSVARMLDRLQREPALDAADVCFTLGTGRAHFDHRVAVIGQDLPSLLRVLERIASAAADRRATHGEPDAFTSDDVASSASAESYYQVHVRPRLSKFTEDMRRYLGRLCAGRQASDWLHAHLGLAGEHYDHASDVCPELSPSQWRELVSVLGALYAAGATIDWSALYAGMSARRVALPTYPFERQRFWIEDAAAAVAPAEPASTATPVEMLPHSAPPARAAAASNDIQDWMYTVRMQPVSPREALARPLSGKWLICGETASLLAKATAALLTEDGADVELSTEANAALDVSFDGVLCSGADDPSGETWPGTLDALRRQIAVRFERPLAVMQSRARLPLERRPELCLVTVGSAAHHELSPATAALWAAARSARREHPEWRLTCVDVALGSSGARGAAEDIVSHLRGASPVAMSMVRDGKCWAETLSPAHLEAASGPPLPVRGDGVYLITGGLGALGLEVAHWLASHGKPRLVLLGRTAMPPADQWDEMAANPATETALRGRLQALCELRAAGAEVLPVAADICDVDAMTRIADEIRERYGPIHGVVHAAGVLADRMLKDMTPDDLHRVFEPKVSGVWVLEQVTRHEPLDFFMVFSSLAALHGNAGQAAYAAANAAMDAWAARAARLRGLPVLSIAWGPWATGMAAGEHVSRQFQRAGLVPITLEQGRRLLSAAIARPGPRLAIFGSSGDLRRTSAFSFDAIEEASDATDRSSSSDVSGTPPAPGTDRRLVAARGEGRTLGATAGLSSSAFSSGPLTPGPSPARGEGGVLGAAAVDLRQIESIVRDVVADVLGLPVAKVAADRPFQELGIDSLLAEEIVATLQDRLGVARLTVAALFEYPTVDRLAQYLVEHCGAAAAMEVPAATQPDHQAQETHAPVQSVSATPRVTAAPTIAQTPSRDRDIAVIGYACRFPGANDPAAFWQLLREGRDATGPMPQRRWRMAAGRNPAAAALVPREQHVGGFLETIEDFDPVFFGLTPAEARQMDPRQRLFLETANETAERAGYGGARLRGASCGVFVGVGAQDYFAEVPPELLGPHSATGGTASTLPSRLAYFLDLKGPCVPVDTACSSSLVALHLAVESLRRGECELAFAGAVHLYLRLSALLALRQTGAISPSGTCRAFDAAADGFVPAEGAGVVLLKPLAAALADGDQIVGVIKGIAVNNDGRTSGLTAPNPAAQRAVLVSAWRDAGIDPATLSYIEAHGTGTPLGDPIEIEALAEALASNSSGLPPNRPFCRVGSVKSNLGHLDAAAGMAGLFKVLLALDHETVPPTLHVQTPNPRLRLEGSPLAIAASPIDWPRGDAPRRAGISAFGFGGTNAHVVVEEPPLVAPLPRQADRPVHVLTLSARDTAQLEQIVRRYLLYLASGTVAELGDICFTANTGRPQQRVRLAVVARYRDQLADKLHVWSAVENRAALAASLVFMGPDDDGATGLSSSDFSNGPLTPGPSPARGEGREDGPLTPGPSPARGEGGIGAISARLRRLPSVAQAAVGAWCRGELADRVLLAAGLERSNAAIPSQLDLDESQWVELLSVIAELYVAGCDVDWLALDAPYRRRRVPLPVSPLRRERCWIDVQPVANFDSSPAAAHPRPSLGLEVRSAISSTSFKDWFARPVWQPTSLRATSSGSSSGRWLVVTNRGLSPLSPCGRGAGGEGAVRGSGATGGSTAGQASSGTRYSPLSPGGDHPEGGARAGREGVTLGLALAKRLRNAKCDVVEAAFDPHVASDLDRTVSAIAADDKPLAGVVYLGGCLEPLDAAVGHDELQERIDNGTIGLVHLVQSLQRHLPGHALDLRIVTRGSQAIDDPAECIAPDAACAWGLMKSVAREMHELRCQAIDLDPRNDSTESAADQLVAELSIAPNDIEVAYRAGQRFVPVLEHGVPDDAAGRLPAIKRGGVYLITGALGGIGMELARWLIEQHDARLVLTSRAKLPPRKTWSRIARHDGDGDATAKRVRQLHDLAERGGKFLVGRADAANEQPMRRLVLRARRKFGRIDGVFHAAGVIRRGLLCDEPIGELAAVLRPKVQGAWVLDRVTADDPPDFCVLFSSVAARIGNVFQADYSAANRFLDSFAAWRTAQGRPTLAINWGLWSAVGMGADLAEATEHRDARAMAPRDALAAMEQAMTLPGWQWIIAPAAAEAEQRPVHEVQAAERTRTVGDIPSPVRPPADLHDVEAVLTGLITEVTGLEAQALDRRRSFLEVGIDSMLALRMVERLESLVGRRLPATLPFDYPDLSRLAAHLNETLSPDELARLTARPTQPSAANVAAHANGNGADESAESSPVASAGVLRLRSGRRVIRIVRRTR